jgi:hypothetical protein
MGARLLLVPIPGAVELADPEAVRRNFPAYRPDGYDLAGPREHLRRLAEAEQIEYVSILDAFADDLRARRAPFTDLYFWCDGHLTARAHEGVAQAIAERLRRLDWAQDEPRPRDASPEQAR